MLLTLLSCRAIYFSAYVLFARSQRYTAEKCRARLISLLNYRAIYFPLCDQSIISIHTGFLVKNSLPLFFSLIQSV